jgi:hypothetical protein
MEKLLVPHSNFGLCDTLAPKTKCVRVFKYNSGQGEMFSEVSHEHFPDHRISEDAAIQMLKALVVRYTEWEAPYIVRCFLNDRGSNPASCRNQLKIVCEYPEPGVMRKYCGTNVVAWFDTVITPESFRQVPTERLTVNPSESVAV